MKYSENFIKATTEYNDFDNFVPAPYIRKSFYSDVATSAKVVIAACGFYELYLNGKNCTKGYLAPYVSNPMDYIYYDEYELSISEGENVIGIMLGNGFMNNPGGYIWEFEKASFRGAPMVSVLIEYRDKSGNTISIESDKSFKTHPSPIRCDDYRYGEVYDANFEIENWNKKDFDDSLWIDAIECKNPGGELKLCEADPIVKIEEIKPVSITKADDGYIYDFGVCEAGVCRLTINATPSQRIEFQHADWAENGELFLENVWMKTHLWERDKDIVHKDVYIAKGKGTEVYTPTFVYHGFRFVKVTGITPEQATPDLLTFVVFHSHLETRGDFKCSSEVINKLQEITRRSDASNFHYFPTDCPQREKNGWTADAALSTEQIILNFSPQKSFREWMRNICKAQNEKGALPGIVPTAGWGFDWGNGPAWDSVLVYIPYYMYIYYGDTETILNSSVAFIKYLRYLKTRLDEDGLMHIGLGDWCQVGGGGGFPPKAPLEVTDSVITMDIANKMALMFNAVSMKDEAMEATLFAKQMRDAIRKHLIDADTLVVRGNCQSCQAMCIFYGVFEENEIEKAFSLLVDMVHEQDDHMDVGVLGGRVIFHVLSEYGKGNLAFKMIARPDYPSYGNWLERGATTLWENFHPTGVNSMNHHFWGDISSWFIQRIAGIRFNPEKNNIRKVLIKPDFIDELSFAEAYYICGEGKIFSRWEKKDGQIILKLEIPENISANIVLPEGFSFMDGTNEAIGECAEYKIKNL